MYPIACKGGFSVPAKGGKFEVLGMVASVDDTAVASRFAIVDDENITGEQGFVLSSLSNKKKVLADLKGIASVDSTLELMFPEPIKTRNGLSILTANLLAGSIIVYTR